MTQTTNPYDTTTNTLEDIRNAFESRDFADAAEFFHDLDKRLESGEPLPDQWQGKSERDVVEAWALKQGTERSLHVNLCIGDKYTEVNLTDLDRMNLVDTPDGECESSEPYQFEFTAPTPDETFALAAKWCREQDA